MKMSPSTYQDNFFEIHQQASNNSAREVIAVVLNMIQPVSVIDIGCGIGTWLSVWKQNGVYNILGVDGNYVETKKLLITKSEFVPFNLEDGYHSDKKYDL